ncbi:hypothetical protein M4I21_17345 [Cellulophaga sp. 20_2_10]|uniref:hypothetical protein n=1 Tax=Cellulophaga sp. 20_2_10 TaxID=2942476 RepID=UPI00201B197B|nr:hypothetical protein [Cellulophaga sp. 20_2_10]MCL5247589.1 hypothetical protein [Cellulophaga sp. 20_2_10]
MSKKHTLEEEQIFAIPLSNDSFTIAQLVNHHKINSRASEDTFAFYNYKFSSLKEVKEKLNELDLSNPFAIVTTNSKPKSYNWELIDKKKIEVKFRYNDNIGSLGLYNNRSTDPEIFLEPYFGLYPWDSYPIGYIDKHILPNAEMGKDIKYTKDYTTKELIEVLGENHIKVKERLKEKE